MYLPEIGRFISPDTYQGDIANPASLNRYSYVLNNPYKYTDPTGHCVEDACVVEVAAAVTLVERYGPAVYEWVESGGPERALAAIEGALALWRMSQDGTMALPPSQAAAPPTTVPGKTPTAAPDAIRGSNAAGAGVATGTPASVATATAVPTSSMMAEHTQNARPSTQEKHQKGQARKDRDKKGGEKGDARRPYSRDGNKDKPKE